MAKEVKTYILFQNYPMTEGRCLKYGAKIRVGASTLKEAIAICQRTFGKTTGYHFGSIDHTMTTVRKNHVKCEVTLIPIYLNLVQINDK